MTYDANAEYGRMGKFSDFPAWRECAKADAAEFIPAGKEVLIAAIDAVPYPVFAWRHPVGTSRPSEGWVFEVVTL